MLFALKVTEPDRLIKGKDSPPPDSAMYTLNGTEVHAVCYRICSDASNSMKSSNPHSGIYQTEISNTLDSMNCGYPACNQGGGCA